MSITPSRDILPTALQAEVLRAVAAGGLRLVPMAGGFAVRDGERGGDVVPRAEVRLLALRGWLEPERQTRDWWRIPHRITEAGVAAAAGPVSPSAIVVTPPERGVACLQPSEPRPEWRSHREFRSDDELGPRRGGARDDRRRKRL